MSDFRLVKIHELVEQIGAQPNQYLAIDVPDPLSSTGYTTKKIAISQILAGSDQTLEEVLNVGTFTGANPIRVSDGSSIGFEKGAFFGYLIPPSSYSSDIFVKIPNESGQLALELDTIEKPIPIFNGSFGLANTGNVAYRPNITIRNRTVTLSGLYILPMPTVSGGSTLDSNGLLYVTNYFSDLLQGGNPVGYNIDGRNLAFSNNPILPSALRPQSTIRLASGFGDWSNISRTVNLNGRTRLSSIVRASLLNDGRLAIAGVESIERNGLTSSGFTKSLHSRQIVDRFENGDSIIEYDNYFTSFDGAFTTDKRVVQDSGVNWNFDHDGTRTNDIGGFVFLVNCSYNISESVTIQQIETAFNSL
jgi:hypothetical protein